MSGILKRLETTPRTRSKILAYSHLPLYTIRSISTLLFIPKSTVHDVISRAKARGKAGLEDETANYPRSGRPILYPLHINTAILDFVDEHPFSTIQEIITEIYEVHHFLVAGAGVERVLHGAGLYSYVARKKPFINEEQKEKRLAWCLARAHWTLEEWRRVIWTDESNFELGAGGNARRCWRPKGRKYAYLAKYLRGTFKSGRTSIQIWGAITYDLKGPMEFLDEGRMDGPKYILKILEPHLMQFWIDANEFYGEAVLMEDNSPVHTAKMCQKYRADHGCISMEWPPQSPDLNPIENLWRIMKHRISKAIVGRPRCLEDMKIALQIEWDKMDPTVWAKLIESMPNRVAECIAAGGGSTHY